MSEIQLRFASIERTESGCVTIFADGTRLNSIPHDTHHYHVIAHRCGYGDDVLAYCFEHDFCHSFVCEQLLYVRSDALYRSAIGKPVQDGVAAFEEMAVHTFQRWLRANERPIIGGVDWDALKRDALALLTGVA